MKTAVVSITTKYELQKAATQLVQAGNLFPSAQPVFCLVDCGVPRSRPQGYWFLSGEDLLGEDYANCAFALAEDEFHALCSVRVLQGLLRDFDCVILAQPQVDLAKLPKFGFAYDTLMLCPRVADAPNAPLDIEAGLHSLPLYQGGFAVFCRGEKTSRFLTWCAEKMAHIMQTGALPASEKQPLSERGFFATWHGYASLFGLQVVPLATEQPLPPRKAGHYAFGTLQSGAEIPPLLRIYYGRDYRLRHACENRPFADIAQFAQANCITGDPYPVAVCAAAMAVYTADSALSAQFPSLQGSKRCDYLDWFVQHAADYGFADKYIAPTREAMQQYRSSRPPVTAAEKLGRTGIMERLRSILTRDLPEEEAPVSRYPFGVNLVGAVCDSSEQGEAARSLVRVLRAANVPFTVVETQAEPRHTYNEKDYTQLISNVFSYNINIFVLNPPQMRRALAGMTAEIFEGRSNIGYWAWPLAEFPTDWREDAERMDEVWAPGEACAEVLRGGLDVPVFCVPYAVNAAKDDRITRADFGLPEDKFLFLACFDGSDTLEPTPPQLVADAFIKAFGDNDAVRLVLKINTPANWNGDDGLSDEVRADPKIMIFTENLPKRMVNSLIGLCDAYVSLHRATSFGFSAAEAMAQGKPVVITKFGGSMQYMHADTCCPVPYSLTPLRQAVGSMQAGMQWAKPDVNAAARAMSKLVRDAMFRTKVALAGQHVIQHGFTAETAAPTVYARLQRYKPAQTASDEAAQPAPASADSAEQTGAQAAK